MSFGSGPSSAGTLTFSGVSGSSWVPNSAMAYGTNSCPGAGNPPGNPPSCMNDTVPGGGNSGDDGSGDWEQLDDYIPPAFQGSMGTRDDTANTCADNPTTGVPAGCVVPSTRIALFPEGCAPAGEIQPGDCVLTRDADGNLVGEVVTAVRASIQPCVLLETEDGRQLHCSLSHEVMVADPEYAHGRQVRVSTLTLDDRLLTEEGKAVVLRSMVRQPDTRVLLICLVGPRHVYLSDGLWSHNELALKVAIWPA